MIVYAIIPARGGSVRIPHKNIVPLRGKPLIEYTIECAKQSGVLHRIVVSTDCCKTATIAEACGVQVVMRPESMSRGDGIHPGIVAAHCFDSMPRPDAVMWLQPTSPLRKPEWIRDAVKVMDTTQCASVISYVNASAWHPGLCVRDVATGQCAQPWDDRGELWHGLADLGPAYLRSGDIYLTKTDVLLSCDLYGKDSRALVIPRDRYCNINEPVDLKIAEALL